VEVLLEGLEEQFDLPAFAVDVGDGSGAEVEMVGEQHNFALVVFVPDDNAPELVGAFVLGTGAGEDDDFVGQDVAVQGDATLLDDLEPGFRRSMERTLASCILALLIRT
jgi:hypothetical protein